MRKLILISALLLASASAQAGEPRGLIIASADQPQATEKIDAVKPAPQAAPVEAPKADPAKPEVKPEAAAPETAKPDATKPVKKAKRHESDEAKARRIAARYGVYW
ncbi:MAG TPA: hypothetical protein VJ226_12500 [Bradyrhizobium sp.]|jgi:hypothetical protein|nr:hypothetical protein [Bradyrhizobium sp.]